MTPVILYEEQPCRRWCRFLHWYSRGKSEEPGGMMGKQISFQFWWKNFPTPRTSSSGMDSLWDAKLLHKRVSSQWGKVIRWNLLLVVARSGGSYNTIKFSSLIWQKFNFLLTLQIQCGAGGIFVHHGFSVLGTQASWSPQKWEGKGPLRTSVHWWHDILIFHWPEHVTPTQLLKRVVLRKQKARNI